MLKKNSVVIGFIPKELRKTDIANISLQQLTYNGDDNEVKAGKIKDLTKHDHIIIQPSSKTWFTNYKIIKCKVSLILLEPYAIHARYYKMLWLLRHKFYRVFTNFTDLAKKYDNVIALPIVYSWVGEPKLGDIYKTKNISLIASTRNILKGHKLRHEIIKKLPDNLVDVMGYGYQPLQNKADGLSPYRYSIIIENCQEKDYFSEKLIDCFLCCTIPIYWGAPNIGDFFDVNGIVIFNTLDELTHIIYYMSDVDYLNKNKSIKINHLKASALIKTNDKIANVLR